MAMSTMHSLRHSVNALARAAAGLAMAVLLLGGCATDPLPSWNAGPTRQAIVDFVADTTTTGSPRFVPPAERIAVFDNDGTLWAEQPAYFQALFVMDRVRALAPGHPGWNTEEPYASVLRGDLKTALAGGEKSLMQLVMATHSGMTSDEFDRVVADWLATARHARFQRPYDQLVYQPMLELLAYLRGAGYKTFIVSGGGVEFMRVFAERTYGIPPEQVVGSSIRTSFEWRDGKAAIVRLPELEFVDDGAGKPVGIARFIGRRPVLAVGNSDGDLQMLQYTSARPGAHLALLVHHTDAEREYAYDRSSNVGRLDKALDAAPAEGWVVIDVKRDWKVVFPPTH
jgi:phosphoglycolate phosphatase-like HAD superfamily hydrolase